MSQDASASGHSIIAGVEHPHLIPYAWRARASAREWDRTISEAGAGLLQSSAWGEFKKASGWSALRLALYSTVEAVGAGSHPPARPLYAAQVLFRRVPRLPFPLSIAYIPRGPVQFATSTPDERAEKLFWRRVHAEARKRGAIFLKVEPDVMLSERLDKATIEKRMSALGFFPAGRLQPARTIALDITASEDDLLKAMKPKTRYNLRLAGRRGVQVRRAETLTDLQAFYKLLQVTGTRDEFGVHTLPYYEQLWRVFGPEGNGSMLVLLAEHPDDTQRQDGPIAGLLALRFGQEAIYMYGASADQGREHMPNYLLQWEAIKWAREHRCALYDFWGIPDAPAEEGETGDNEVSPINARSGLRGVYWFKKGFGGREIEYPGAFDYIYNPLLYKLWVRWRGADLG